MNYGPFFYWTVFLWLGLTACGSEDPAAAPQPEEGDPVKEKLEQIREVAALGKVKPEKEILSLGFEVGGRVARIAVAEGRKVEKGDLLIYLDDRLEQNRLHELAVQRDANDLDREDARRQVEHHQELLRLQQQTFDRLQRSVQAEALPASRLDEIELQLAETNNQIEKYERRLRQVAVQARTLQVQEAEVRLQLDRKRLSAPGPGFLFDWTVREGELVTAFASVGEFAPAGELIVEAEVDEYFADRVQPGQAVYIRKQGYRDTLATGTVFFTADYLADKTILSEDPAAFEDLQVRRIKIRLDAGARVLIGAKVEAVIRLSDKE